MTTKQAPKLNEMSAAELISHFGGVSAAIRALDGLKWDRGQIAKALGKRYQHVRNVLITPVKNPKAVAKQEMSKQLEKAIAEGGEYGPAPK